MTRRPGLPTSCAALAGLPPTTSGRSAIARARCRWATLPRSGMGRPVIAILNTWSDAQPCHMHFKSRVDDVQARHPDGRRLSARASGAVAVGILPQADHDALPQHACDGRGGAAAWSPCRRRRADGRLRQDHAGSAARRNERRPADDLPARRARCCAATGRARCSARARTPGNTGTSVAPARYPTRNGSTSRPASRAAMAPA